MEGGGGWHSKGDYSHRRPVACRWVGLYGTEPQKRLTPPTKFPHFPPNKTQHHQEENGEVKEVQAAEAFAEAGSLIAAQGS